MTARQLERRAALFALLDPMPPGPKTTRGAHGWMPPGRTRWPRGEALKRDLATAWVAHQRQRHAGEYDTSVVRVGRVWRRA